MDVEIGGVEIRDPVAVVLRLAGVEVGRQPYDGITSATWYASMIDFDEVVVETSEGEQSFQAPNGGIILGTGSDIEIPGRPDPWSSQIPLIPKVTV